MTLHPDTIRIFVSDISRAQGFYQDILELPLAQGSASQGYLLFEPGGIKVLIESCDANDDEGRNLVGRFVGLSFRVPNVREAYEELRDRGAEFSGAPEAQPWGGTLAHVCDPDRNILTLVGTTD
jgi:predicted enzyme related to lactoylglutathione lyase